MDLIRNNADETTSGDDLALVLEGRPSAVGSSHGSASAEEDSHAQVPSGQSYNRVTAGGSSRLHAGNVYNSYYQVEPSAPRFATTNEESDTLETFLRCLSFEQIGTRLASIATAHPHTCAWVFDCPPYKRWRDRNLQTGHHGCLWIKGKPGAGKSTIVKTLLRHTEASQPDEKVISFFFNARGALLERTTEGMYRSILFQMAGYVPSPLAKLRAETIEFYGTQGWPLELLKDLCRQNVRYLTGETGLTVFIDALDEGNEEDDVRDMVTFIEELAADASSDDRALHVCLASRHYPAISMIYTESLLLDTLNAHDEDISTYVRTQLRIENSALRARLVSVISVRASGVFLWVVLVVRILNKEADHGNQHQLEAKLQAIPDGLHALYNAVLEKDNDQNHHLLPALIWVLFAKGSLKPVEAYFAIIVSTGQLSSDNIVWDPKIVDHTMLASFLLSSSRGLLELIKSESGPRTTYEVQVIHESVREYLLLDGLKKLDDDLGKNAEARCHARLAKWCAIYVQSTVQYGLLGATEQASAMRKCPLLEYTIEYALAHAELAAQQGYQEIVYAEAPVETWRLIAGDPSCTTMLHLLVLERLPHLVQLELKRTAELNSKSRKMYVDTKCRLTDEAGRSSRAVSDCSALELAVSLGDIGIVRILLAAGADANVCCERHGHPLKVAQHVSTYSTDIFLAGTDKVEQEMLELVKLLVENGAVPPSDISLENPATMLSAVGTEDWGNFERLLQHNNYMARIASDQRSDWETLLVLLSHGARMGLNRYETAAQQDLKIDEFVAAAIASCDPKSQIVHSTQDDTAESTLRSRIYHGLWGTSIRQNLPY
jgi:hypothetical protein